MFPAMRIVRKGLSWLILGTGALEKGCLQSLALAHGYRVCELCLELGCSERYLRRVFLRDIGLPPKEWMRQERMLRARRMIGGGVDPSETAQALGFATPNSFRREFREVYGVTPVGFLEWKASRLKRAMGL